MRSFNPMMILNKSETSATRRLLQCTGFGLYMNDISSKFAPPDDDFASRRAIVHQVAKWCETYTGQNKVEWVPILYLYEIVKGSAKRQRDWGHLLFTEPTLSCFLIVMIMPGPCNCGNYSHHDHDVITRYQADRMMSLVTYLHDAWDWGNAPNWVRATYTTPNRGFMVDSAFLLGVNEAVTPTKGAPPIFHVTPDAFTPTLLDSELERIDNVCTQGRQKRAGPAAVEAARLRVLGTKEDRPDVGEAWMNKNPRECANCHAVKDKALMICSRCKLAQYCSKECQKAHWSYHKIWCKTASAAA
ncbi:hypothetical protein FOMPIDRAFT_1162970 [Fomitopsis schrenkii]|uniref:MYND-type domain-containing protein n=1 Tax=Fomitopsis schrenkii TaxID=2126942 RepID=S8FQN1_FOMSC|nr:hypothetical protein FOMPIDRAFT_1162970 [Fomitopsis schrenkii]